MTDQGTNLRTRMALFLSVALALAATEAHATSITVDSGSLSSLTTDTSTAGTQANPWTIDDTMTDLSGTLRFDGTAGGTPLGGLDAAGTGHNEGRWFSKTVTNSSGKTWASFVLELVLLPDTPSVEADGLSFAEGSTLNPSSFGSDVFAVTSSTTQYSDTLYFSSGSVADGASVTFNFVITDNLANSSFYLVQAASIKGGLEPLEKLCTGRSSGCTPNNDVAVTIPAPASLPLLAIGFGMFARLRRKHTDAAAIRS